MKSVFTIDDNGRGMEEIREFLRERGYSAVETSPETWAELRFTQFAVDRAGVQVFWLTRDQRIIYVNEAACRALGYAREELTRMSIGDIDPWYPGLNDHELAEIWNRFRETGYDRFETNHRARDGRVYPVEVQCNFLEFEGKECSCCFVTDISERKQFEEKLLLQQFCIENADTIFMQFSTEGKILMVNEYACRSLGYTRDELLELSDVDITQVLTYEKRLEYFRILDAGGSMTGESVFWRKDGSTFPVEFTANKLDFHGKPFFIGFFRDITERKKAEEALRMSQFIVDHASIGIYRGHEDGRILYANEHNARMLGYSREELCSMTFFDIIPDMKEQRWRDHRLLLRTAGSRKFEAIHRRKDGTTLPVEVTVNYMEFGDNPFSCSFVQDITDRKRVEEERKMLEEQLHQARKMEAIGQLAGGIAHDFNNILTAIMGFAEVTAMRMEQADPLLHNIRQILEAAERASDLTHGLLAFSRKQVLHKRVLDVHEVVEGIKKMLCRLIPEDIDFRVKTNVAPMTVMADKGKIEQVLMNLVTNARDAMPGGGLLTVETGRGVIDGDFIKKHGFGTPGAYAMITVEDTGCGIDEETREKIFEPFFTTKKVGKGTGLGLSIIYGIVKQHDGFLTMDSSSGRGTVFCIYLPLADNVERGRPETVSVEPVPGGSETILLVEDDDAVRGLTRGILEQAGYAVIETADGREALERFGERPESIDILVTDVVMPNMDGKRLCEEIMGLRPDMKVLFMSGYAADVLDARGVPGDGVDFMAKPSMPSELLKKLREILDA